MDPNAYYKYTDLGTVDNRKPKEPPREISEVDALEKATIAVPDRGENEGANVVYDLDQLSTKRPGPVLAVGFGNPLKSVVKAATAAEVTPLYTTGTEDKLRAFSFGGTSQTVCLGKKFDERLFTNEHAVLEAASSIGARTILWVVETKPSKLLQRECLNRGILMIAPMAGDKTRMYWEDAQTDVDSADLEGQAVQWRRCAKCGFSNDVAAIKAKGWNCPTCGELVRLSTDERMALTFDEGTIEEWETDLPETNPMDYPDFDVVIERARSRSGYDEGVRVGTAKIEGIDVAFGIMEPTFMMGSMGSVVGEKLTRMIELATELRLPVVIFAASGGARMQEGLASLMQMAKTSAALERHSEAGLLYVSVLTDPTTGGVTASFATLGDIILAEPHAIIGFAGRRVIQDTIKQTLPEDFQTAEFALEHGLIDAIVERKDMRDTLAKILRFHGCTPEGEASQAATASSDEGSGSHPEGVDGSEGVPTGAQNDKVARGGAGVEDQEASGKEEPSGSQNRFQTIVKGLASLRDSVGQAVMEQADNASLWWALRNQGVADAPYMKPSAANVEAEDNRAWNSVQLARNVHRPTAQYYIASLLDDFVELHGDRAFSDDAAIVAGIGSLNGSPVTIIGQEKGATLKEKIVRNFGCSQPEGYRKSMRLMKQAEKFGRPIVCLVDTQGAFCGKEAEERGMGNAIAENLALMASLTVPVVTVILGEGGSGGALALAVANKVAMQENAVYSVLSPEGFASILWKDGSRAPEAASVMKMSAADALGMGMIEDVIPEGVEPAHENPDQAAAAIWLYITNALEELSQLSGEELKEQRYKRFRTF